MPTAHDRIQVTCDERVERILQVGAARYPGRSPGRILVELAAERIAELDEYVNPLDLLAPVRWDTAAVLTAQRVDELLDDDE